MDGAGHWREGPADADEAVHGGSREMMDGTANAGLLVH
jgi:hypothetical protein